MATPSVPNLIDLRGKTALVTGARRGVGAATAEVLAGAGADLVLVSRHIDPDTTRAQYAERFECMPLVVQADVTDEAAMRAVIETAVAHFDGVDILVNNAAINHTGALLQASSEEWFGVLNADLVSVATLCRLAAPGMIARRFGRIINIASNLGAFALRDKGVYSAAKAGLMQLTRNLALELAPSVLVNCLAVGAVATDIGPNGNPMRDYDAIARTIPLGRLGRPDEIARVILFLASELSTYITGQTLFVDGGAGTWFPA
jgi:NAD(P)-dependent dehydrogenase (short-subunit alcohol dehydrogenase family)